MCSEDTRSRGLCGPLLNSAIAMYKQPQTICKQVGVAVLQSGFIYENGVGWVGSVGPGLPILV